MCVIERGNSNQISVYNQKEIVFFLLLIPKRVAANSVGARLGRKEGAGKIQFFF
jgi:hypothetical protein